MWSGQKWHWDSFQKEKVQVEFPYISNVSNWRGKHELLDNPSRIPDSNKHVESEQVLSLRKKINGIQTFLNYFLKHRQNDVNEKNRASPRSTLPAPTNNPPKLKQRQRKSHFKRINSKLLNSPPQPTNFPLILTQTLPYCSPPNNPGS